MEGGDLACSRGAEVDAEQVCRRRSMLSAVTVVIHEHIFMRFVSIQCAVIGTSGAGVGAGHRARPWTWLDRLPPQLHTTNHPQAITDGAGRDPRIPTPRLGTYNSAVHVYIGHRLFHAVLQQGCTPAAELCRDDTASATPKAHQRVRYMDCCFVQSHQSQSLAQPMPQPPPAVCCLNQQVLNLSEDQGRGESRPTWRSLRMRWTLRSRKIKQCGQAFSAHYSCGVACFWVYLSIFRHYFQG